MNKATVRETLNLAGDKKVTFVLDNSIVFSNKDSGSVTICDDDTERVIHLRPSIDTHVMLKYPFEIYVSQYEHIQGMYVGATEEEALEYINKYPTSAIAGFDGRQKDAHDAIFNSSAKRNSITSPTSTGKLDFKEPEIIDGSKFKTT